MCTVCLLEVRNFHPTDAEEWSKNDEVGQIWSCFNPSWTKTLAKPIRCTWWKRGNMRVQNAAIGLLADANYQQWQLLSHLVTFHEILGHWWRDHEIDNSLWNNFYISIYFFHPINTQQRTWITEKTPGGNLGCVSMKLSYLYPPPIWRCPTTVTSQHTLAKAPSPLGMSVNFNCLAGLRCRNRNRNWGSFEGKFLLGDIWGVS